MGTPGTMGYLIAALVIILAIVLAVAIAKVLISLLVIAAGVVAALYIWYRLRSDTVTPTGSQPHRP